MLFTHVYLLGFISLMLLLVLVGFRPRFRPPTASAKVKVLEYKLLGDSEGCAVDVT